MLNYGRDPYTFKGALISQILTVVHAVVDQDCCSQNGHYEQDFPVHFPLISLHELEVIPEGT